MFCERVYCAATYNMLREEGCSSPVLCVESMSVCQPIQHLCPTHYQSKSELFWLIPYTPNIYVWCVWLCVLRVHWLFVLYRYVCGSMSMWFCMIMHLSVSLRACLGMWREFMFIYCFKRVVMFACNCLL